MVYEDSRGTGPRRPGDRGIPGVMVSNGRDVAVTGPAGEWALPAEPGDSLFVVKPPQWATRTSADGLPQFSYLYQPQGTPGRLRGPFPVVEPTGPLPASIDFPLQHREERPDFEAILVSDTQPESAAELNYVRDDILPALLSVSGAAFAINHGDVVADDLGLYPRYLRLIAATGLTWHHCPGNHDLNSAASGDLHSRETWKVTFGPRHYAFQHGAATFLVLDNVEYLGDGRYRGAFGPRQLGFVSAVLDRVPPEHLVVVSMHIPLVCHLDPGSPADTTADRRALVHILSRHRHTVSFAGHLHATEHHYLPFEGPFAPVSSALSAPLSRHHHHVLTAACGSWWSGRPDQRGIPCADSSDGTPNGFHTLSVSGNRYHTRFIPAASKAPAQLRVLIDGPHRHADRAVPSGQSGNRPSDRLGLAVPLDALPAARVLVNVFDGGPRTRVTVEVAGPAPAIAAAGSERALPAHMTPLAARDPLIAELFQGDTPRKSWVEATPSSHLWHAPLPRDLGPGVHVLLVRARDEYGREHLARTLLEVTPPST